MTKEEYIGLIEKNKKEVQRAVKEFEEHSKKFDEKMKKILSVL